MVSLTPPSPSVFPHYSKKIVKSNFNYVNVSARSLNMEEASQLGPVGNALNKKKKQKPVSRITLPTISVTWSNSHNLSKSQIQVDAQELL